MIGNNGESQIIGNKPSLGQVLSYSKDGLVVTTYADDNIVKGNCFQIQRVITVTDDAPIYIVLDTTALVGANKILFILPLILSTAGGNCKVETYPIESYTGGNEIKFARVNSTVDNFALSKVYKDVTPVGNVPDDEYREYSIGTKSTNQSSGGGLDVPDIAKKFPSGSLITAKISTLETSDVELNFGLIIFEI
jgi:hypothetical protein